MSKKMGKQKLGNVLFFLFVLAAGAYILVKNNSDKKNILKSAAVKTDQTSSSIPQTLDGSNGASEETQNNTGVDKSNNNSESRENKENDSALNTTGSKKVEVMSDLKSNTKMKNTNPISPNSEPSWPHSGSQSISRTVPKGVGQFVPPEPNLKREIPKGVGKFIPPSEIQIENSGPPKGVRNFVPPSVVK